MRLNLNQLYYFYVVAKEGSIKAASLKLHLTQPTVSVQIRQLEDDLGFDVFRRSHRKLSLNSKGRFLLKKAEKIFTLVDELSYSLPREQSRLPRIEVRIGAIQSLSNSFIYDFSLRLWQDQSISVSVAQGSFDQLFGQMKKGNLDILLNDFPVHHQKKYKSVNLGKSEIIAVASKSLAAKKKNFPQSLDGLPYLAFSNQGRLQEDIDFYFERTGIQPERVGEVDDVTLLRVIVQQGHCFALLPRKAVEEAIQQKKMVQLGKPKNLNVTTWAISSSIADKKSIIDRVIKDYLVKK